MDSNSPSHTTLSIDQLIDIVRDGGTVKTGVDVFGSNRTLLLEKNVLVNRVGILLRVKEQGVRIIPVVPELGGGLWTKENAPITLPETIVDGPILQEHAPPHEWKASKAEVKERLNEIVELKRTATQKHVRAKNNIKKVITSIRKSGGEFDVALVEETVTDLFQFVTQNCSAFSYLTKEIFAYDDYLYNHSINVCAIGTAIMQNFNNQFSKAINRYLISVPFHYSQGKGENASPSFSYYFDDELRHISLGFFIHDLGKVLIPEIILNKKGELSQAEFALIKEHSISKAVQLLEKNKIFDPFTKNICRYHHTMLFDGEERCYPLDKPVAEVPPYVRVCKLADIYDALTSKRCYKEAMNPVLVVADIFHKYAERDRLLQFILHSFVKSVGIFPPGSIVYLENGQMAYIIESEGPIVVPITDRKGKTLVDQPEPINLGDMQEPSAGMTIDRQKPLVSPIDTFEALPSYLKKTIARERKLSNGN